MKRSVKLAALAATAAVGLAAGAAHADDLFFTPLPVTPNAVSYAGDAHTNGTNKAQTYTDNFSFTIGGNYNTTLEGTFFIKTPSNIDDVSSADLSLFEGLPGAGPQTPIATTGLFDVNQSKGTHSYDLNTMLSPNVDYYLQVSEVVAPGKIGAYSVSAIASPVSAAPEPGIWALMIAGIGLVGAALRMGRRRVFGTFA